MKHTKIEWADHTFNPWIGCTKVSPACDHCYAESLMGSRMHVVQWGVGQPRKRTSVRNWNDPLRWNAEAERLGVRYRVFCASLADVFDNEVPTEWRRDLFSLIELTPRLDWLLLTKRIGNVARMVARARTHDWLLGHPNVWLGATICNQAEAERDIPKLLDTPAARRFLSIEPMLGPIDLRSIPMHDTCSSECCGQWRLDVLKVASYCGQSGRDPRLEYDENESRLDWVIVGGESGPHARPMHPDWVRSLRDQCVAASVPFLFKRLMEGLPEVDAKPVAKPGPKPVVVQRSMPRAPNSVFDLARQPIVERT